MAGTLPASRATQETAATARLKVRVIMICLPSAVSEHFHHISAPGPWLAFAGLAGRSALWRVTAHLRRSSAGLEGFEAGLFHLAAGEGQGYHHLEGRSDAVEAAAGEAGRPVRRQPQTVFARRPQQ